jgi:hypothetical protein
MLANNQTTGADAQLVEDLEERESALSFGFTGGGSFGFNFSFGFGF